ncbi:MAG: DUF4330 domain-containing protein [Phormidium sp. GEM2.Bin31]|nr:MAG: DUF4330 domain-containing protein [Phormidium sp. GEM2.Bin31]
MKLLDSKGRLFGKISLLDIGAIAIIFSVFVAVFLVPGTGGSVAQVNLNTRPVEVTVIVRGLSVFDANDFVDKLRDEGETNIIIRNQPHGKIDILNVERLPRTLAVPQPDGTVAALEDPRSEELYSVNLMLTLAGNARMTDTGPVLGNSKLKIGTPVELEGTLYNFNGSVINVNLDP